MSGLTDVRYAPLRPWAWLAAAALLVAALLLDGTIIGYVREASPRLGDFHMLLRVIGTVPAWLVVFLVVAAVTAGSPAAARIRWEFVLAIGTGALAAGLAALLKPIVRRPDLAKSGPYEGWAFAPWGDEPWDGSDLCFPSEHAAVSWGVCLTMARFHPQAAWAFLLLGFGTSCARVASRGHHPSDVAASLLVAMGASLLVERVRAILVGRSERRRVVPGQS